MDGGWKLPEQAALANEAEMLLQTGEPQESVLAFLRKGGMSKLDSMRVLSMATGIPLLQCKDIVQRGLALSGAYPWAAAGAGSSLPATPNPTSTSTMTASDTDAGTSTQCDRSILSATKIRMTASP